MPASARRPTRPRLRRRRRPASADAGLDPCGDPDGQEEVERVSFRDADGFKLDALTVGAGDVGVVLAHQFRSDYCSWVPYARFLAARGIRALAVNFDGSAAAVTATAGELRRLGARNVFLVGASMGGTAALVAAADARPPVSGVVAVSAPVVFQGADAGRAVRRLDVPVVYVATRDDQEFPREARLLYRATKTDRKRLVVLPGFEHGTDVFGGPAGNRLRTLILDFVRANARA